MPSARRLVWKDHNDHLRKLAQAAIEAVDPYKAVARSLRFGDSALLIGEHSYALDQDACIYVVGAGKAGEAMAKAVESILGDHVTDGVIAIPQKSSSEPRHIRLIHAGHPLPTKGSIQAGEAIQELLVQTRETDIVLALISGGGSALLELPLKGLELQDLQRTNDLLIKSGAPIQEINIVRRQLSRVKGGGITRMAAPARAIALILSDVVGDDLKAIASGPTVLSATTAGDAIDVLEHYKLTSKIPPPVLDVLRERGDQEIVESPYIQQSADNILIGSNLIAAEAAVHSAEELGFETMLLTTYLKGEAREAGRVVAALVKGIVTQQFSIAIPACIVLGGETTVTVRGDGQGGRNQELALAAAIELAGWKNIAVMSLATDGIDGPTPAAGAIVSGMTFESGRSLGLDAVSALEDNDSYSFFKALGESLIIGPTGTNVNDLIICTIYKE
jgi:glycerate 2-kinase